MGKEGCLVCKVATILGAIGALNWGLVAVANINLVDSILGAGSALGKIVYILVGLSGLALLAGSFNLCPKCKK